MENKNIYKEFAHIYSKGQYPEYSRKMSELLPSILRQFKVTPKKILDIACGEGSFALEMAIKGFQVTGIDRSADMLRIARKKTKKKKLKVKLIQQDMCSLKFSEEFNLVTCWFDSLNYLLENKDLENTFLGVSRALKEGGIFIFDMNTIYGLSVQWQENPSTVEQDIPRLLEIHQTKYNPKERIATLKITVFIKKNEEWIRIDEVHKERGYTLGEIRQSLKKANLEELACWGSLAPKIKPTPSTGRVWFVAKKISQ
ncbi:class I SAM-dependent methyltransferase [candidate division WOR-3 bacterium]|nr:class I SAM-dependent methyltransferase [candidate division WOR-3 bacterium]